jgi:predicted NBD/HSP70 family sugar kinase
MTEMPITTDRTAARILDAVRLSGRASRAEISQRCQLSRSTVTNLVDRLLADGLLREAPPKPGAATLARRGRPAQLLALTPRLGTVIGVAFGHTDLRAAMADQSGAVLHEEHVRLAVEHSAPGALDAAAEIIADLIASAPAPTIDADIIIGLPCPIDSRSGRVLSNSILPGWIGVRPADELGARLGRSIRVENDANLAALGEHSYGAGQGHSSLIFVKVSTGIGAGLILDNRLFRGSRGASGEIGHTQVASDGAVCRCGNRGCLETVASARSVLNALAKERGREIGLAELTALLDDGDVGARRVMSEAGHWIGGTVAALCDALDPQLIIVGGALAETGGELADGIAQFVNSHGRAMAGRPAIRSSRLGPRAEVLGAIAAGIAGLTYAGAG